MAMLFFDNTFGSTLSCEFRVHRAGSQLKNLDSLYLAKLINQVRLGEIDDYRQIVPNDQTISLKAPEFLNLP